MESLFIARLQEKAIDFRDGNKNMATALHAHLVAFVTSMRQEESVKNSPFKTNSLKTAD